MFVFGVLIIVLVVFCLVLVVVVVLVTTAIFGSIEGVVCDRFEAKTFSSLVPFVEMTELSPKQILVPVDRKMLLVWFQYLSLVSNTGALPSVTLLTTRAIIQLINYLTDIVRHYVRQ